MWPFRKKKKLEIVEAFYHEDRRVLFVKYSNGELIGYHGSETVWRETPWMGRCDSSTEGILSDIYAYIKVNGNPYPTSHLKKQTS